LKRGAQLADLVACRVLDPRRGRVDLLCQVALGQRLQAATQLGRRCGDDLADVAQQHAHTARDAARDPGGDGEGDDQRQDGHDHHLALLARGGGLVGLDAGEVGAVDGAARLGRDLLQLRGERDDVLAIERAGAVALVLGRQALGRLAARRVERADVGLVELGLLGGVGLRVVAPAVPASSRSSWAAFSSSRLPIAFTWRESASDLAGSPW
jgi:hypothetical protein